ncbi:MAG: ATP-binding protein, partial [Sedimentisphaerales bacterium]
WAVIAIITILTAMVIILAANIVRRKKVEEALQRSRKDWEETFNAISEWVVLVDLKGRILRTNRAGEEFTGKPLAEIVGQSCCKLVHGSEKHIPDCPLLKMQQTGQRANAELRIPGTSRWLMVTVDPVTNEEENFVGAVHITCDITARKKAEEKLFDYQSELKSLTSRLTLAEERERRRIAMELHDRISQSLTISKLELDELRSSAPAKRLAKKLKGVCNSLGQAIADTRSLTFDLSSPILYELGFEAAVAGWLSEQIEKKHGITTNFEDDNQPKPLDDDVRVLLFRDVRELLMNVVKHANAKKIKVSMCRVGGDIEVRVEDDGWGFDPKEAVAKAVKTGGFGLFSIKERLEELGGHLEIESEAGCGTKVTLIAPLKQEKVDMGVKK